MTAAETDNRYHIKKISQLENDNSKLMSYINELERLKQLCSLKDDQIR